MCLKCVREISAPLLKTLIALHESGQEQRALDTLVMYLQDMYESGLEDAAGKLPKQFPN